MGKMWWKCKEPVTSISMCCSHKCSWIITLYDITVLYFELFFWLTIGSNHFFWRAWLHLNGVRYCKWTCYKTYLNNIALKTKDLYFKKTVKILVVKFYVFNCMCRKLWHYMWKASRVKSANDCLIVSFPNN